MQMKQVVKMIQKVVMIQVKTIGINLIYFAHFFNSKLTFKQNLWNVKTKSIG
jgi:hypothetical protein